MKDELYVLRVFTSTSGLGDDDDSNFITFEVCGTLVKENGRNCLKILFYKKHKPFTQVIDPFYGDISKYTNNIIDIIEFFTSDDVYEFDGTPLSKDRSKYYSS